MQRDYPVGLAANAQLVRDAGLPADRVSKATICDLGAGEELVCPPCGSDGIVRLAANRVSPFPGYWCRGCGLRMRPHGAWMLYVAVLVACVGLVALFTLPHRAGEGGQARVFPFIFVVAAFSVYQLLRPTPSRARPVPDDEPDVG